MPGVVPVDQVLDRPLHPGFRASWQHLRAALGVRPAISQDAANVVGSVPDGWWKDRAGATRRPLDRIETVAAQGLPADALELAEDRWFPQWRVVVEGRARSVAVDGSSAVDVVRAEASGDDATVAEAVRLVGEGRMVTVVTSDRGLAARVVQAGATVREALAGCSIWRSDAEDGAVPFQRTGIVLCHEVWGITPPCERRRPTSNVPGTMWLSPTSMGGAVVHTYRSASTLRDALTLDGIHAGLQGAIDVVQEAGATRVVVIGYSMGGAIAPLGGHHPARRPGRHLLRRRDRQAVLVRNALRPRPCRPPERSLARLLRRTGSAHPSRPAGNAERRRVAGAEPW